MIFSQRNLYLPALKRTARRVVRWTTMDTILGAVGGAIFGVVFGGLGRLLQFEPSPIASIVGYFAVCGAVAGALVGIYGGIVDDAEASETACPSPLSATPSARRVDAIRESSVAGQRQSQNRLAAVASPRRKPREVAASQNPSWN